MFHFWFTHFFYRIFWWFFARDEGEFSVDFSRIVLCSLVAI